MAVCGEKHTFFVTINGQLLAAGLSESGALGCMSDSSDYTLDTPQRVNGLSRVKDVATCIEHTLAIDYDTGDLYGWGRLSLGKLGLGNDKQARLNVPTLIKNFKPKEGNNANFVMVACSAEFSIALDSVGGLWYTGMKNYEGSYGIEGMV